MKNIALVGFMGTGKSVVAKTLADKLGMAYVATDEVVVRREGGKPIHDIFKEKGEPYFRDVEAQAIREAAERTNIVIDCGGGTVIREENLKHLKRSGVVICLTATPEVIYSRVKDHRHRPLLNVPDPQAAIRELLTERAPFYGKADYTIDTSQLDVEGVIERILKVVKR